MIQFDKTKISSVFVFLLVFFFFVNIVQSDPEDILYSRISEITINTPNYSSEYNYTDFDFSFIIELYNPMNEVILISTPHSILFNPHVNVSFANDSYSLFFLYGYYTVPTDHSIPPNTTTYLRDYPLHFTDANLTRLPEGNYTLWFELDGPSPITYQPLSSFINVNDTTIEISHEEYNGSLFVIPEYSRFFVYFGTTHLCLIILMIFFFKKRRNH